LTRYSHDFILVGATGQVGRYLLPELQKLGSVAIVGRDTPTSPPLPVAKYIVNAAGCTKLDNRTPYDTYWRDNINLAVRLAHHAEETKARLYQLSSVAVAEFRSGMLFERTVPIPDTRQLRYSQSKCLMELAVRAVSKEAQIIRLGDVVPPIAHMAEDWRKTHWLSILFSCGQHGFDYAPPKYSVWLATAEEVARAITKLFDEQGRCFHVLGQRHFWTEFQAYAEPEGKTPLAMAEWMTKIVLYGPEGQNVNDAYTKHTLSEKGFEFQQLYSDYWRAFAMRSLER
jgi:nucleoside-diphosphate-sugar epimerase